MYCPKCKITFNEKINFCPICGTRLSQSEYYAGAISDEDDYFGEEIQEKRGARFNFSKPLCLIMAAILLASMLVPWFRLNATVSGLHLIDNKEVSIFRLRTFIKGTYESVMRYMGAFVYIDEQTEQAIWIADGALLMVTLYFAICAVNFILFGLTGLFSKGKARYFFARVGGTLYVIGTILMIAAVYVGQYEIRQLMSSLPADAVSISFGIGPCWFLFAAALIAVLFRTLGMRLLRYLNGISCLNKGDYRTAERELTKINCTSKLQKSFSRHRSHGKVRFGAGDIIETGFGDGIVN